MTDAAAATDCRHETFVADVAVGRIQPDLVTGMPYAFVADIHVNCAPVEEGGCGIAFTFAGVPCGLSYDQPRCSVDGAELRAPIRPANAPEGFGTGLPSVGARAWVPDDEPGTEAGS